MVEPVVPRVEVSQIDGSMPRVGFMWIDDSMPRVEVSTAEMVEDTICMVVIFAVEV